MATGVNMMDDQSHMHCRTRISWSAIITGALMGMGLSFLLNLFGVTIGLSAFSMSNEGPASLAVGGLLGLIISTIVAFFVGGFTAGHLGRLYVPKRNMGITYGFTTWTVTLVLSAVITTHVGHYVDHYKSSVTNNTLILATDEPSKTASTPAAEEKQQKMMEATSKEISGGMAIGTFIVFMLFFLGALSSCVGAHYGMSCRKEN